MNCGLDYWLYAVQVIIYSVFPASPNCHGKYYLILRRIDEHEGFIIENIIIYKTIYTINNLHKPKSMILTSFVLLL